MSTNLGTLGFHFDGRPCRVACSFCYLGLRSRGADALVAGPAGVSSAAAPPAPRAGLEPSVAAAIVAAAPARDVAVAISEPAETWRSSIEAVVAAARARGLGVAVTTTPAVVRRDPWVVDGCTRLTLSIDPDKGKVDASIVGRLVRAVARPGLEIVGLVSLVSPALCDALAEGELARFLDEPGFSAIALNGLKPPPPWCTRAFWLHFLWRLRPLLDQHLGRRLHLDCYVNARILELGGCPGKPDVAAGHEFRACVYQQAPDFVFEDAADLATRTAGFRPPATCPFPIC